MNQVTVTGPWKTQTRMLAGFTLVELLVVIGIIGMLIALLLPAVMSGQEQARQTQCAKQMKDLAGATLAHTMKKGRFPGWRESSTDSWVVRILPYLDMQQQFRQPSLREQDPLFYCPSNTPEDDTTLALGYRANTGSGSDGIFVDRTDDATTPVGLEDVRDGKKNTLLLSESAQIGTSIWGSSDTGSPPAFTNNGLGFKYTASTGATTLNEVDDDGGQASSFHQEGFNVAYCDGHTEFFFFPPQEDDTDLYQTYTRQMTHNGSD